MKRIAISVIASLLAATYMPAQNNNHFNVSAPIDILKKEVYGFAKLKILYDYTAVKNAEDIVKDKEYGKTMLLIGDDYIGFSDWVGNQRDSLNDVYSIQGKNVGDLLNSYVELNKQERSMYLNPLVINRATGECIVRTQAKMSNTYEYTQQLPTIKWTLEEEEKKISGIKCNKATCHFGGRDWEAWYSTEYPISFGPYLFNGLPGLIIEIKDTKKTTVSS